MSLQKLVDRHSTEIEHNASQPPQKKVFSNRLKDDVRSAVKAGSSHESLAKALKISRTTIGKWMNTAEVSPSEGDIGRLIQIKSDAPQVEVETNQAVFNFPGGLKVVIGF